MKSCRIKNKIFGFMLIVFASGLVFSAYGAPQDIALGEPDPSEPVSKAADPKMGKFAFVTNQLKDVLTSLPTKFKESLDTQIDFEKATFAITFNVQLKQPTQAEPDVKPTKVGIVWNLGMAGTGMHDSEEQILQSDGSMQTTIIPAIPLAYGFNPGRGMIVPRTVTLPVVGVPVETQLLINAALSGAPKAKAFFDALLTLDPQTVFVLKTMLLVKTAWRNKSAAERKMYLAHGMLFLLARFAMLQKQEHFKNVTLSDVFAQVLEKLRLKELVKNMPKITVSERKYWFFKLRAKTGPTVMEKALGYAFDRFYTDPISMGRLPKSFTRQVKDLTTFVKTGFVIDTTPLPLITKLTDVFDRERLVCALVELVSKIDRGIGQKDRNKNIKARAHLVNELLGAALEKMEAAGTFGAQTGPKTGPRQPDFLAYVKTLQGYTEAVAAGNNPKKPSFKAPLVGQGEKLVKLLKFADVEFFTLKYRILSHAFKGDAGWTNESYVTLGYPDFSRIVAAIGFRVLIEMPQAAGLFAKTDEGKAVYAKLVAPTKKAAAAAEEKVNTLKAQLRSQPTVALKNLFNSVYLASMRAQNDLMKKNVEFKKAALKFVYKRNETSDPESLTAFMKRELVSALLRLDRVRQAEGKVMDALHDTMGQLKPFAMLFGLPLPDDKELAAAINTEESAEDLALTADLNDPMFASAMEDFGISDSVQAEEPVASEAEPVEAVPTEEPAVPEVGAPDADGELAES